MNLVQLTERLATLNVVSDKQAQSFRHHLISVHQSDAYLKTLNEAGNMLSEVYERLEKNGYSQKNGYSKRCVSALKRGVRSASQYMTANSGEAQLSRDASTAFIQNIKNIHQSIPKNGGTKMAINTKNSMLKTIRTIEAALEFVKSKELDSEDLEILGKVDKLIAGIKDQLTAVVDVSSKASVEKSNEIFNALNAAKYYVLGNYSNRIAYEEMESALALTKEWSDMPVPKFTLFGPKESDLLAADKLDQNIVAYAEAFPAKSKIVDALKKIRGKIKEKEKSTGKIKEYEAKIAELKSEREALEEKHAEVMAQYDAQLIDDLTADRELSSIERKLDSIDAKIDTYSANIAGNELTVDNSLRILMEIELMVDNVNFYADTPGIVVEIAKYIDFEALDVVMNGFANEEAKNRVINIQKVAEIVARNINKSTEDVLAGLTKTRQRNKASNENSATNIRNTTKHEQEAEAAKNRMAQRRGITRTSVAGTQENTQQTKTQITTNSEDI